MSQDKAHLLEQCSLLEVCLYVCGCVSFYVFECVLDNSANAEPVIVRPLVDFFFILVNKTPKTHSGCILITCFKTSSEAGREYKKEQTSVVCLFFFHSMK